MERRATLTLWRLSPPFRRAVEVRQITVGGFLDLVRTVAPKAAAALVKSGRPLTDVDLIRACADADTMAGFADLVLVDQPVGFMRGWLDGRLGGFFARRNTDALLAACRVVEGDGQWTRFLSCLNRGTPGQDERKPKGKGGGLMADVLTVSGLLGLDPNQIRRDWFLRDFLDMCDSLNLMATARQYEDPTMDPDAEPSPGLAIPGLFQVH